MNVMMAESVMTPSECTPLICPVCAAPVAEQQNDSPLHVCQDCSTYFRRRVKRSAEETHWNGYLTNSVEQRFDELRLPSYRAYWSIIRRLPAASRDRKDRPRLLDVGCVPGMLLELAAADGWDAHGVELTEELCAMTRSRATATVHQGRFEEIDFGGQRFDAVVASDVLRHTDDPIAFLQRAFDVIRPGGVVIIRDIDPRHPHVAQRLKHPTGCDMQMFTPQTLCRSLRRIGFGEVGISRSPASLLTVGRVRLLAEHFPKMYEIMIRSLNSALSAADRVRRAPITFLSHSYLVWGRRTDPNP